ncbi:RipA family octameric membrane protein [Dactylosporangium salmoneum]|uniref:RipA family octameric membrane protein n=1 Tax=Dactylosporangium salmoneum TaxID=53361 RepID=UPI0031E03F7C
MAVLRRTRSYFFRKQVEIADIRQSLWSKVGEAEYGSGEKYQAAILDQYKTYVEMADRLSARRGAANTLFLAINTAAISLATVYAKALAPSRAYLLTPVLMLVIQCGVWFWVLRSYRQLSSAKHRVIGALEERLPASPYWRAEWDALGRGKDPALYWPVASLEQWVPAVYAAAYVASYITIILA